MVYNILWILLRPIALLFRVDGKENIPKDKKPIIIVANHIHELDPVKIALVFPFNNHIHWFTKREAFHVNEIVNDYQRFGIFKWLIAGIITIFVSYTFSIPVDRESVASVTNRAAIRNAIEVLKNNGIVGIFGEGGIGREGKAHPVFIHLAKKTGAIIIPVKVHISFFRKVTVGTPILMNDEIFNRLEDKNSQGMATIVMDLINKM